jgi:hypothetical protein
MPINRLMSAHIQMLILLSCACGRLIVEIKAPRRLGCVCPLTLRHLDSVASVAKLKGTSCFVALLADRAGCKRRDARSIST